MILLAYDDSGRILTQIHCHRRDRWRIELQYANLLEIQEPIDDIHTHRVIDGSVVAAESALAEPGYAFMRPKFYGDLGQQLNMLYDDIAAGKFGANAKTSSWFAHCTAVKQQFPKNN